MKDDNKSELLARLGSRMTFGTAGKYLLFIRQYGSSSYVGMGWIQNGVLYLRYGSHFAIVKAERCKAFTHKNLHYFILESASRLSLTFLKVEKIVR